jgi:nitroreductase
MSVSAQQMLALIEARQSGGQLSEPAPDDATLALAIQAALAAPDHHRLRPWRFLTVRGDARQQMGQVLADALLADGDADAVAVDRVRQQPLRAPLIVVCVTRVSEHPKVPEVEQVLSTGAAVQNMLLMLHAQGFAAIWRTGALTESAAVHHAFGLAAADHIAGFVYIGTAVRVANPRTRLPVDEFLAHWPSDGIEPLDTPSILN